MKPIVGVVPLWDDEKQSLWILPGYMNGISEAGGIPVLLPLTDDENAIRQLMDHVDGILFTGGHDVAPELYGEEAMDCMGLTCPARDAMEKILLKYAVEQNKAALGICRGIQFMNAGLGGTLYQDLPLQHPSSIVHHQPAPYHLPSHKVSLVKGSPIYDLFGKDQLAVNSCHHQAIRTLAPGLRAMAISDDDLIEAVYMPDRKFFWGVQWHPEFAYWAEPDQRKIFEAFVSAME